MSDSRPASERCCVLIPFKDRREELLRCLNSLFGQLSEDARLILVDDGSAEPIEEDSRFQRFFDSGFVEMVRHPQNRGVAASRNTGVRWSRERDFDIIIMTDSDCVVPADFIERHLALQKKYPDVPLIGSTGRGFGTDPFWGHLDYVMSWFHVIPGTPEREMVGPYTVATANVSIKAKMLPFEGDYFETYLHTGEDAAFCNRVRAAGFKVIFSPEPEILHENRGSFRSIIKHQCEFSQHHYFVYHMKYGLQDLCWNPLYRMLFIPVFFVAIPFYALLGCYLSMGPWVRHKPAMAGYLIPAFGIWLVKGFAVLRAPWNPKKATRAVSLPEPS